jgi:hypothetical protein
MNRFQRWVVEAIGEAGGTVPADVDPLGATFEAEGHVARIFPHGDEGHAVIEVTACSLHDLAEDAVAGLAVPLLRLNHEARFEHAWAIVLDDESRLNVTTTVALTHTSGRHLAELLYDGIDRAAALSKLVAELVDLPEEPEPESAPIVGMSQHIRA